MTAERVFDLDALDDKPAGDDTVTFTLPNGAEVTVSGAGAANWRQVEAIEQAIGDDPEGLLRLVLGDDYVPADDVADEAVSAAEAARSRPVAPLPTRDEVL
jgi:hypothetical protein